MERTTIILISGKVGAGKTTLAKLLTQYLEIKVGYWNVELASFAGPVKKFAKDFFNWNGEKDANGRLLLQNIGATGRSYDKDFWIAKSLESIYKQRAGIPALYLVYDDWRYPNEYEFFLKTENKDLCNPIKIRIIRPTWEGSLTGDQALHESETALDCFDDYYFDYLINNDKRINELDKTAKQIIDSLF